MLKFFIGLLFAANLAATAGQEGEHFVCEVWQRADGKYHLRVITYPEDEKLQHLYKFDRVYHSDQCECGMR